jgi:hypothetical protein
MIITKSKNINEIIQKINKKSVFIVGCSECATICKTGGEIEVKNIIKKLNKEGLKVTGSVILDPACHKLNNKRILKKYKNELNKANKIVVLSCGNGAQTVSEIFEDKEIICGTDTIFLGEIKRLNEFEKRCDFCGNCIINNFNGICPISRCPKNILNGPCGGSINGKCEINSNMDCVWYLIINKLNNEKNIKKLKEIIEPFDWSSSKIWRVNI